MNENFNDDRLNVNGNNDELNENEHAFEMALANFNMNSFNNLYKYIYSAGNIYTAWRKARKGKTNKDYVIEFEKDIEKNLLNLHNELKNKTYRPRPLETFILRDPKTRKISKSDFRDRIVHHAIYNVLNPIYERIFIYDSFASRKGKGNLKAIERFYYFMRKVSRNGKINGWLNDNQIKGYCLKADIKHYFEEVNHNILMRIISRKIKDEDVIWLIKQVLNANFSPEREREINSLA